MEGFKMELIEMGAVRAKVKLTNAIDEAMVSRGVLAPHLLREYETQALVDTGALTLVIPQKIVEELGLRIRSRQVARYANGFEEPIDVTEAVLIECQGRQTAVEALVARDEVLTIRFAAGLQKSAIDSESGESRLSSGNHQGIENFLTFDTLFIRAGGML